MSESKKEYTAVYRQSRDYAQKNGEILDWRQSFRLNIACKQAVEFAVRENFDGMHLKEGALAPVLKKFGAERVGYVLANTLQEKSYDGRFSRSNKEWAAAIAIPANEENGGRNYEFEVDSPSGGIGWIRVPVPEGDAGAGRKAGIRAGTALRDARHLRRRFVPPGEKEGAGAMSRRYSLTLAEQETMVNYDNELSTASIYTHDPRMINKLRELEKKYPRQFRLVRKGPGRSVTYEFPKKCLGIRPPYSEARKRQQAADAKANGLPFLNTNQDEEEKHGE